MKAEKLKAPLTNEMRVSYLQVVDRTLHASLLLRLHFLVQRIHHALIARLQRLLKRLHY
jgi:hypothetical protein